MMTSNDAWVVPAEINERRFFVLRANSDRLQDSDYFANFTKAMSNGGREALMQYLLEMDLSEFNIRQMPKTSHLQEQKVQSYEIEHRWWFERLKAGEIFEGEGWPNGRENRAYCKHVRDAFLAEVKRWNCREKISATKLARSLQGFVPYDNLPRKRASGYVTHEHPETGHPEKLHRPQYFQFPTLQTCRQWWDVHFGGPFDWPIEGTQEEMEHA